MRIFRFKKILCTLIIFVTIFNFYGVNFIYATNQTMTLNEFFLKTVKSWADSDGNLLVFDYQEGEDIYYDASTFDIEDFWNEASWENHYNLVSKEAILSNQIYELINKVIRKLEEDYEKKEDAIYDTNYYLYQLLQDRKASSNGFLGIGATKGYNNGEDIIVTVSGDEIISIDISAIANTENGLDRYGLIKIDHTIPPKTEDEKLEEEGAEKISEGIYKYKNGRYFCTANIAAEVWDKNYIYGQIQDTLLLHVSVGIYVDWPKIFELYGDNVNKIKVYFDKLDKDGKPTGSQPKGGTAGDIEIHITLEDLQSNPLPEGEDPTYYSDQYYKDKRKNSPNLGGILLGPVFSLVNYVADAVISITGSIMYPEKQDLDFGLGVLTNTKPKNTDYTKTYPKNVDVSTFLPTNLWGRFFYSDASIKYKYPHLNYTPEEIFSGKVELLGIDFVTGKGYDGQPIKNESMKNIRKVISQWYQVLRMIAIIGLLSVLIYTGIKIMISANAKDKAKYKEWIINWLMAVAILFFMHYIMAFTVSVTGEFSKLMTEASQGIHVVPSDNKANAFDTNLMGLIRFMIQTDNFYMKVGYEVMYIALIWYTLKFTFTYLKRVLNMAFLTLIAPIVALTYPIDKISDGKAQGFDMWLKEYIFNALLQPMHCILYYILVGSAIDIAVTNPIYGIVVLGFMAQAEKLLKKIFGFDKARGGTVGGMANAFAAGAIASNIAKMAKLPKGNAGKGEEDNGLLDNPSATEKDSGDDLFDYGGEGDIQQRMLDADKENGEFDSDPERRETLEREVNPPTPGGMYNGMSDDEYRDYLRDNMGMDDETIKMAMANRNGAQQEASQRSSQQESAQRSSQQQHSSNGDSGTPIRKMARGMGNVGKRLAKPIYDFDHSGKYNGKRFIRNAGRAAFGAALGVGAAAVQAGISITDGKYNPMEGMASFAAGYAGAGQIAKGIESLGETYKEGTLPDDPDARKQVIMERAQKEWADREDVIKHNKNKYSSNERKNVIDIQKQLLAQGVTDVKEMDDCIKYIKSSNNGSLEGVSSDIVRKARVMHDFSGDANVKKVMYDPKQRKGYIDSVAKDDREKRILENKFNEVIKYDKIVNKK